MAERVKQQFRGAALRCFSLARGKRCEWRPRRSTRRLITLIFAGRNRMLMIRRELPRTRSADWARRACRIKVTRVLLIENASTATGTAFLARKETCLMGSVGLSSDSLVFRFYFDADDPDKTQQLSSYCRYDLRFVFATCEKFSVAQMQSVLSFPSNVSDLLAQSGLTFEQVAAQPRAELISPSRFDNHSSKMRVASLRNAARPSCRTTGIFTRNQAAVGHELPGGAETRDFTKLGNDGNRGDLCNAPKGLESGNHGAHPGRRQACRLLNGTVQTFEPHGDMLDLVNIVSKSNFLRRLFEVDLVLNPLQVRYRPRGLQMLGTLPPSAQQKLAKAMTSTQLVSVGSLTSSHQVAKSFVSSVRNPHRRPVTGPIAARQFHSIAPIGFHSVPRFHGYESRRDHFTAHPQSGQLPIQHIPCGSGLVADSQLLGRAELVHQLPNRLRTVRNDAEGANFPAGFSNGYCDGVRMDIETDKSYFTHETDSPFFACGSVLLAQRNPRIREMGGSVFYFWIEHAPTGLEPVRP